MQTQNMTWLAGLLPLSALALADPCGCFHTVASIWIANLLATVFVTILLFRQVGSHVPGDLINAARIDGCGFWRVCWHVLLPLVLPGLGFLGIFILVAAWDDTVASLIDASARANASLSLSSSSGLWWLHLRRRFGTLDGRLPPPHPAHRRVFHVRPSLF